MSDILTNLRRLEAEATAGPWKQDEHLLGTVTSGEWYVSDGSSAQDAALIAAMRNALPALLDVAEAAAAWKASRDKRVGTHPPYDAYAEDCAALDEAIAALRKVGER